MDFSPGGLAMELADLAQVRLVTRKYSSNMAYPDISYHQELKCKDRCIINMNYK